MEFNSKYGKINIFAQTIEQEAISQIIQMANSPVGENAHIRIMPDAHAGAGCTIGTTMKITDKVCPNLVGVDIGCGVMLVNTNIHFEDRLNELDEVIRKWVPSGFSVHEYESVSEDFVGLKDMYCWDSLSKDAKHHVLCSIGTLGGGNHYIEAYKNGWISVHSGSRNLGVQVCKYYQNMAEREMSKSKVTLEELELIPKLEREAYIKSKSSQKVPKDLAYVSGDYMEMYLHDMEIAQKYAAENRRKIIDAIISAMGGKLSGAIESVHNYIDTHSMILRKGAISAKDGDYCVIPMNMRDGVLVCKGKGNQDWNYSAPHGAGRLYSRSKAKELFTVAQYKESMEGIYTTCVSQDTLDEAPFVYKNMEEIMECIYPTVEIVERLTPIYNFKAK